MTDVTHNLATTPVIDAHHHLWQLDPHGSVYYPWLQDAEPHDFFLGDYSPLRRNYLPPDYRIDSAGFKLAGTVHVEAECSRDQQVEETQWLSAVSEEHGMPNAIVAHAWFHTDNSQAVMAAHSEYSLVRGIRSKPITTNAPSNALLTSSGSMQDPAWQAGFKRLRDYGFSWDLRVPAWHLAEAAAICQMQPDIPVVLNHMGFPWNRSDEGLAMWRSGMQALAACEQVSCKLSCLCTPDKPWNFEQNRDLVRETIDLFGIDRCMFASNFPVDRVRVSYAQMFADFDRMTADLSDGDRLKLFHDNTARFYRMG